MPPAAPSPLPAVAPANPADLNFKRLLSCCERLVQSLQQEHTSPGDAQAFIPHARLQQYVSSLKDQLWDLERLGSSATSHPQALPESKLSLYRQRVNELAAHVRPVEPPAFCRKPAVKASAPSSLSAQALSAAAKSALEPPRATQGQQPEGNSNPAASADLSSLGLSDAAREKLKAHEALQESLTNELAQMAARLKEGALSVQDAVRIRGELVDSTEVALDNSLTNAKDVSSKSKQQYRRGGGTFCLTLLVVLIVATVFSFMAIYIKMTYFMGHRSSLSAPRWGRTSASEAALREALAREEAMGGSYGHEEL